MSLCVAIKNNGEVCGKRCTTHGIVRCNMHITVMNKKGPFKTARDEMLYTHKRNIDNLKKQNDDLIEQEQDAEARAILVVTLRHQVEQLVLRQNHEMDDLIVGQNAHIRRTGIDPDAPARERRRIQLQERHDRIIARQFEEHNNQARQQIDNLVEHLNNQQQVRRVGELAQFANDRQNVHTPATVKQTDYAVERLLKIPVPEEYRWNLKGVSKTISKIIEECKDLSPQALWQLISKYSQDEEISNYGKGIYGRILDGVVQFALNSPHKESIFKAMAVELQDSIGMCAQGNLSRLCNIVAGYMEGIGSQESVAEVLGRKLPMLMQIEDQSSRLEKAYQIFVELGVPEDQWLTWAEPLIEDGELRIVKGLEGTGVGLVVT